MPNLAPRRASWIALVGLLAELFLAPRLLTPFPRQRRRHRPAAEGPAWTALPGQKRREGPF